MSHHSISEEHGLACAPKDCTKILSVGISTEGLAEARMAETNPACHVTATTIDEQGAEHARTHIAQRGLTDRIDVKIENVAEPSPYPDDTFGYIYARLVLHYLDKQQLADALAELYRISKPGGALFVVVRSTECPSYTRTTSVHDQTTGITTYETSDNKLRQRYFHTKESICGALQHAGFVIRRTDQYDERLSPDFLRTTLNDYHDNVIEVLAAK